MKHCMMLWILASQPSVAIIIIVFSPCLFGTCQQLHCCIFQCPTISDASQDLPMRSQMTRSNAQNTWPTAPPKGVQLIGGVMRQRPTTSYELVLRDDVKSRSLEIHWSLEQIWKQLQNPVLASPESRSGFTWTPFWLHLNPVLASPEPRSGFTWIPFGLHLCNHGTRLLTSSHDRKSHTPSLAISM